MNRLHDVRDFGAVGDGRTLDTVAIQRAIDACWPDGGLVRLREGTFLSGTLTLRSHVTFVIEPGATLLGSTRSADYPDLYPATLNGQLANCRKALLYLAGLTHVTIEGGGTLDGQNWAYERALDQEAARPMAIFSVGTDHLAIRELTVRNSAMWSVVSLEVSDLHLSKLTVHSEGITRDGLVLIDCHRARVSDCTIDSGDDGICLKSHSAMGVKDVTVRRCRVRSNTNALKLGTPTYGPVEDVLFDEVTIERARLAGIAVEAIDGSSVRNLAFHHLAMTSVGAPFFVLQGDRGLTPAGLPKKLGSIEGLHFRDVTATSPTASWGSLFTGTQEPLRDLTLENVTLTALASPGPPPPSPREYGGEYPDCDRFGVLPASGLFFRHVRGLKLIDCSSWVLGHDERPPVAMHDVEGLVTHQTHPVTTIRVTADVGFGHSVTLRGSAAPLDWAHGLEASWGPGNVWTWQTRAYPLGAPFHFKVARDDVDALQGEDHRGLGGQALDLRW